MTTTRRGITLVEILVVLGIIGLLLAILIPAVQHSREAARKTTCQNNLRQQAIAVHTYESTHGRLPSLYNGSFMKLQSIAGEFDFHSWQTAILPHLELNSLYQKIDQSRPPTAASNQDNLNVRIPLFECPSTSNPSEIVPEVGGYVDGEYQVVGSAARADYEAVSGFQFHPPPPGTLQSGEMRGIRFGVWGEPKYNPAKSNEIIELRVARFRDVSDGLSSTLLISELAGRPDFYRDGKLVDAYPMEPDSGHGGDIAAAAWGMSTSSIWMLSYDVNVINSRSPYGFHESGANVAFADGSVKFLSEQTSTKTLAAMSTRAAGDIVNNR